MKKEECKCYQCNRTAQKCADDAAHNEEYCGLTKVRRWPGDQGAWQCDDCRESSVDDVDLDEYEEKKRERIARENEY